MALLQPAERRRLRSRADARRAILDATEALLLDSGPAAFSMRRLAERCGYTPPTIYHYFGDKQRLIDALLDERCRVLVRSLKRVRGGDDAAGDVRAYCLVFARFGLRNPTYYALLSQARQPEAPPPPAAEEARALLEGPLERLAAAGRLRADHETTGQTLWAFLHGFVLLRTHRADVDWKPRVLEVGLDALLASLVRDDAGVRAGDREDRALPATAAEESTR
jgi:AcrR family transcriptional regulator